MCEQCEFYQGEIERLTTRVTELEVERALPFIFSINCEGKEIDSLSDIYPGQVIEFRPDDTFDSKSTYTLGSTRGEPWIECRICGRRSFHPEDIKQLYCGHCHAFHPIAAVVRTLTERCR